jgi:TolB protein
MKPVARQIFSIIIVGLVASVRFLNAAVGAETADDHRDRFLIAVPDFVDSFTSDGTSGRDLAQTITADLQADGRFILVNSSITLEANTVLPRLDRWRSTNAEWLIVGRAAEFLENGKRRLKVEFRLWDVVTGTHALGGHYFGQSTDLQNVSHDVAAKIIEQLTSAPDSVESASDHPN